MLLLCHRYRVSVRRWYIYRINIRRRYSCWQSVQTCYRYRSLLGYNRRWVVYIHTLGDYTYTHSALVSTRYTKSMTYRATLHSRSLLIEIEWLLIAASSKLKQLSMVPASLDPAQSISNVHTLILLPLFRQRRIENVLLSLILRNLGKHFNPVSGIIWQKCITYWVLHIKVIEYIYGVATCIFISMYYICILKPAKIMNIRSVPAPSSDYLRP